MPAALLGIESSGFFWPENVPSKLLSSKSIMSLHQRALLIKKKNAGEVMMANDTND